jgi:hypothetical protein
MPALASSTATRRSISASTASIRHGGTLRLGRLAAAERERAAWWQDEPSKAALQRPCSKQHANEIVILRQRLTAKNESRNVQKCRPDGKICRSGNTPVPRRRFDAL